MINKKLDDTLNRIFKLKPSVSSENTGKVVVHYDGYEISIRRDVDSQYAHCWINGCHQGNVPYKTYEMFYKYYNDIRMSEDYKATDILTEKVNNDFRKRKLKRITNE